MAEFFTGLRLDIHRPPEVNSASMKRIAVRLSESGKVTFSQFLFPYVDSILIAGNADEPPFHFGSHMLLCGVPDDIIADCAGCEQLEIIKINADVRELRDFFSISGVKFSDCTVLAGDFTQLAGRNLRSWAIREQARYFCSFIEHIDRMNGCSVAGTCGGHAALKLENTELLPSIADVFRSKTGETMTEWR